MERDVSMYQSNSMANTRVISFIILLFSVWGFSLAANAQANLETFGQNRIQYKTFNWRFFETEHFRVYHYDRAGRQLARYVAEQVENDIKVIEKKLGGQFPDRFNIILYNSYEDYRQTNIGRKYDGQLQNIPAGTVNLVGDKLVVYFTGVHTDLQRQTRSGMSQVVMEHMLFGENFRDMVRNAVLLNLPEWTIDGFMSYLVDGWDAASYSKWKNEIEADTNKGFHELAERNPELAGKAFWKYIGDKYGESEMKNLLYNMQAKGSLAQGLKMTTGQKVKQVYAAVIDYYKEMYALDEQNMQGPDSSSLLTEIKVPNDNTIIRDIKVAPRGNDVAYVSWKDGEFKVIIQKSKKKQQSVILAEGRKDYNEPADPNYPLLAWSNTGFKLAILYKKGTENRLRIYNSIDGKIENYVIPSTRFDRVLGMTFMEDDDKMVFSAVKRSQTDLYEYIIRRRRLINITDDAWDDIAPSFVSGGAKKGIIFLSNRPKPHMEVPIGVNELPTGPMNVFFYDMRTKRKELLQMSNVEKGTVTQPIQYGYDNYAYLYDSNGIRNKYVVMLGRNTRNEDSAYSVPVTDYSHNILEHQYNPASQKAAEVVRMGNKYKIYFKDPVIPYQDVEPKELQPTALSLTEQSKKTTIAPALIGSEELKPETKEEEPILRSGNAFRSEFENEEPAPVQETKKQRRAEEEADNEDYDIAELELTEEEKTEGIDSTYIKMRPQTYRLAFKPDFFSVRVDNSVLFNRYQPAGINGNQFNNPSLGGLITVSLNDVMEDHRFTGGMRLPLNITLPNTAYFLQYENAKRRVDWSILFLRTANTKPYNVNYADSVGNIVLINEQLGKVTSNLIQGSATYPLDRVRSIRMHMGLRQDKLTFKSQDTLSLSFDPPPGERNQYWTMSRAEFVFDNTKNPELNIWNGFRYKFFGEYLYKVNGDNGGVYNFGTDFRYYHKIYKNVIWANRVAAAHSGGKYNILYFLGGVDNWINRSQAQTNVRDEQYGFQSLATNLRGYRQNAMNGNSYAVLNSEIRFPVLTTFFKKPIQSAFLRHLQVVGFADLGSAWSGFLPSVDNLQATTQLQTPDVTVLIENEGGLGFGYGAGLRTMLFGYFLRVDAAWNREGLRKPLWHISIGTDF